MLWGHEMITQWLCQQPNFYKHWTIDLKDNMYILINSELDPFLFICWWNKIFLLFQHYIHQEGFHLKLGTEEESFRNTFSCFFSLYCSPLLFFHIITFFFFAFLLCCLINLKSIQGSWFLFCKYQSRKSLLICYCIILIYW